MKHIKLGRSGLTVPAIAVGCMRINEMGSAQVAEWIDGALEMGANFFDHADIYGRGACEELFGQAMAEAGVKREDVILQSKCGIIPGKMYDCSKEHILESVEKSLKRLGTEYLDVLLLHRPDALIEPEEVAEAFDELERSGKVRHFGVSNQNSMQMELLRRYVKQELAADQLQLSVTNSNMIRSGLEVNMQTEGAVNRDGSVLDYCRLHDITIQVWSPFQYGFFEGVFLGSPEYPELNQVIDEIAKGYGVSATAIATAWIMRHPAEMQMIAGTTKLGRLRDICESSEIVLGREEWYRIYLAAGHMLP